MYTSTPVHGLERIQIEELSVELNTTYEDVDQLQAKILHVLGIYPGISSTMLQMGLSPSTPPKLWRPILDLLVHKGFVTRRTEYLSTPTGRSNTYIKIFLTQDGVTYDLEQARADADADEIDEIDDVA